MKLKSPSQHNFANVPTANIERSSFRRPFGHKGSMDSGYLVPFFLDEVVPGDTFNVKATIFARLATQSVPLIDNLYLDTFWFYVPNRLLWNNFKKFMGEQDNPTDSTVFAVPQVVSPAVTGWTAQSLFDYLGIPIGIPGLSINALPSRAYNLIWNEWFRDENLQNSVTVDKGDGPDTAANYVLLKRGKRKDYFTSALPWPQKGTAVNLPLSGNAPVKGIALDNTNMNYTGNLSANYTEANGSAGPFATGDWATPAAANYFGLRGNNSTKVPNIYADMSAVNAATINSLRQAFQIQKLIERDARGGTRYVELVKSHFGVTIPDYRAQRPEFLGGGSYPVMITPVAQTSGTSASGTTTPLGNLAAYATCTARGDGFVQSFVEHGLILGLMMIRADLTYQQGINKMFLRSTRYDYFWPELAHLGEQAIENREIYAVDPAGAGDAQNKAVFGYQERYAEYRYKPSQISGQLRSTYATTLDYWHLSQKFLSLPVLNTTFIQEAPPVSRVVSVVSGPQFIFDSYVDMITVRPMPVVSIPGYIDHF